MTRRLPGLVVFSITAVVIALTAASGVAVAQGNVASATGSGQIYVGTDLRTFTFTARTDSAGNTTGQTAGNNRNSGYQWHGVLTCLSVSGNVATMSGVVTEISPSTPPFFVVGNYIQFQVIDNGEGAKGTGPDLISLTNFYATGSANPGCTGTGTYANIPISHGNVQVH
jgi:hypothetical protein